MRIERVGVDEYWVVEKPSDLHGWTIVHRELWKDGVVRLHCRSDTLGPPVEFRLMYCPTTVLDEPEVVQ